MNGNFIEIAPGYLVDPQYKDALLQSGLTNIDAIFSFNFGENLSKKNLASHRTRLRIEVPSIPTVVFLKRFEKPPVCEQIGNWLSRRRKSSMRYELDSANNLADEGIQTARVIAYGEQWGFLFEKRSFIITEQIHAAEAIERTLPECFCLPVTSANLKLRRAFISELAQFAQRFHQTGFRHRDFYFAHIFYGSETGFHLIDLQRVFKPGVLAERFRVKDIAQLYYSAPRQYFSLTDRLRFYLYYSGKKILDRSDKVFIRKVVRKVRRMARHDARHGRPAPFEN
jgi:heptose I phosphotransferase